MRQYNKQDVEVTRQLYKALAPYHTTHPDMNVKAPVKDGLGNLVQNVCPVCLSGNTHKRGKVFRSKKAVQSYSCQDCGHRFAGK